MWHFPVRLLSFKFPGYLWSVDKVKSLGTFRCELLPNSNIYIRDWTSTRRRFDHTDFVSEQSSTITVAFFALCSEPHLRLATLQLVLSYECQLRVEYLWHINQCSLSSHIGQFDFPSTSATSCYSFIASFVLGPTLGPRATISSLPDNP